MKIQNYNVNIIQKKQGGASMNIKQIRISKGMTQDELSKELQKDRSTIAKWENAESLPRADMLPKLARVLGCSIDDLFGAQDDETKAG